MGTTQQLAVDLCVGMSVCVIAEVAPWHRGPLHYCFTMNNDKSYATARDSTKK
jgi:hypothetical protein